MEKFSFSLAAFRQSILDQIQKEGVPEDVEASHNAFEIENIETRECYSFILKDDYVTMYDTGRGRGNLEIKTFGPTDFPYEQKTAKGYFDYLYRKSLAGVDNYFFIGYVDPDTFQPIDV